METDATLVSKASLSGGRTPVYAVQAAQSVDAEAESAIAVSQYHANTDADEVDLALVEALLMYVCGEGAYKREGEDPDAAQGAVLIFLPGPNFVIHVTSVCPPGDGKGCTDAIVWRGALKPDRDVLHCHLIV